MVHDFAWNTAFTIRDSKEVNLCLTLEFKDVKKLVDDRKLDRGIMVLSPYLPGHVESRMFP
jgi:hypothetical protein